MRTAVVVIGSDRTSLSSGGGTRDTGAHRTIESREKRQGQSHARCLIHCIYSNDVISAVSNSQEQQFINIVREAIASCADVASGCRCIQGLEARASSAERKRQVEICGFRSRAAAGGGGGVSFHMMLPANRQRSFHRMDSEPGRDRRAMLRRLDEAEGCPYMSCIRQREARQNFRLTVILLTVAAKRGRTQRAEMHSRRTDAACWVGLSFFDINLAQRTFDNLFMKCIGVADIDTQLEDTGDRCVVANIVGIAHHGVVADTQQRVATKQDAVTPAGCTNFAGFALLFDTFIGIAINRLVVEKRVYASAAIELVGWASAVCTCYLSQYEKVTFTSSVIDSSIACAHTQKHTHTQCMDAHD